MEEQKLIEIQNSLNTEKYYESEHSGIDMSGNMQWCKNCMFQNLQYKKCDLSHETRTINKVCAKNYLRGNANEQNTGYRTKNSGRSKKIS